MDADDDELDKHFVLFNRIKIHTEKKRRSRQMNNYPSEDECLMVELSSGYFICSWQLPVENDEPIDEDDNDNDE